DLARQQVPGTWMASADQITDYRLYVNYITNGTVDFNGLQSIETRPEVLNGVFIGMNGYWQYGKFKQFLNVDRIRPELKLVDQNEFLVRSEVEKMSKSKFNV